VAVPAVLASVTDAASGEHYLATAEVAGEPADRSGARGDGEALVALLARGLRALHDRPVTVADPLAVSVDDHLARAGDRVRQGLVDRSAFEPIHARYTPEQLYEHLLALRPPVPEDRVLVHGDPTLDNTIVAGDRVAGYVDVGRAGVADRYLDLAIVARDLANRVSPHALGPFFAEYGIEAPDVGKVDFYLLLDEFF
jgi:aminoglycoside phosphotransferase